MLFRSEQFINKTSPFCVFDAIEMYAKYNFNNDFMSQINTLFKLNKIDYNLSNGQIQKNVQCHINLKDVSKISEEGLKDLINEADNYYYSGEKSIATEKIWDAFERLKTYY